MGMRPYGLMADIHCHNWSAFATVNEGGVNSRLVYLMEDFSRCCEETRNAGGDTVVVAGDFFHVRGSLAPSVLNYVIDAVKLEKAFGMKVIVLAGNHDLEGKNSDRLGSAVTALEGIGCKVVNTLEAGVVGGAPHIVMVPWMQNIKDLMTQIEKVRDSDSAPGELDLILHAPINGVFVGVPDHGLESAWLASLGFRRVFAGHYHNYKDFGNGVYSIGALAQHTWGDVNSKAGFLIVGDDVKRFKSRAPEFIELDGGVDPAEIPLIADGNYVRVKIKAAKQKEVEELREFLMGCGAKGVVAVADKDTTGSTRMGATVKAGASLETSVGDFIKSQGFANETQLVALCMDVLSEARSAA